MRGCGSDFEGVKEFVAVELFGEVVEGFAEVEVFVGFFELLFLLELLFGLDDLRLPDCLRRAFNGGVVLDSPRISDDLCVALTLNPFASFRSLPLRLLLLHLQHLRQPFKSLLPRVLDLW